MVSIVPIAVLVLFFGGDTPTPPMPSDVMVRTIHSSDGVRMRLAVNREQAIRVPEWHPEAGYPPPLDLKLAIELARDSVRNRYPQFQKYEVISIDIAEVGREYMDKWFYMIKFRPILEDQPVRLTGTVALVLMDGTVVEPTTVTED